MGSSVARLAEQVEEVLVEHRRSSRALNLAPYRGDPVRFAREILRFAPYDTQVELLEAPETHKYTVARGGHAVGKDATISARILYDAFVEGRLVLVLSATERQLLQQTWVEVKRRFQASKLPGRLLANALEIGGVRRVLAMTSGATSNLTGFHDAAGVAVYISEAQGETVEAVAFDAAISNAADDRSIVVAVGNPIKPSGRFYEVSQKPHWHQIAFSVLDHPNIRDGKETIAGGPSAEWVEEVAREYGRTSGYFQSRVLGEFPSSGAEDALIARADLDRAFARFTSGALAARANNCTRRLSADIARGGPDSTCVIVEHGPIIESIETFHEADLMRTAKRLHAMALRLGRLSVGRAHPHPEEIFNARCQIIADDAGLGGGITDRLRELGARVSPFNGANSAKREPEKFANRRAEAYWDLRERLLRNSIAIPPDERLAEELLATTFSLNGAGKIILAPKDDIRSRLGRSPDRGDALSMACEHGHTVSIGTYAVR